MISDEFCPTSNPPLLFAQPQTSGHLPVSGNYFSWSANRTLALDKSENLSMDSAALTLEKHLQQKHNVRFFKLSASATFFA